MASPGRSGSNRKRGIEEGSDGKNAKGMDDVDHEGDERRKYNSRKSSHGEEVEYETRKEAYSDKLKMKQEENVEGIDDVDHEGDERRKHDSRKSRKSSHGEEVEYETRKETCYDKLKMQEEEGTLEKLSNRYGDIDLESKQDGGDKSGGRAHTRLDDEKSITRKAASKFTDTGGSLGESNKDSSFSVKSGNTPVKLHGSSEHGIRRSEYEEKSSADRTDSRSGKSLDLKNESVTERSSLRDEICKGKQKALESSEEKDKSYSREERRADTDGTKRRSRTPEKSRSGIGDSRRSRTPEKSGKYLYESYISDMDHDRSSSLKEEELDKEAYDDDRNKDRDGSKDHGKQVQLSSNDGDGVVVLDRDREWELPRHSDRYKIWKDKRDVVIASSNFEISTENYDVIEVQREPLDGMRGGRRGSPNRIWSRGRDYQQVNMPVHLMVPLGKAPSKGEHNDYSQNFVDTGKRPQNFISDPELSIVEGYPKLRELIQKKDEIVAKASKAPMYYKCDLQKFVLSPDFFGTKFDVILVDPPWEEYVNRAPGFTDGMESWTCEEIMNLNIEAIADSPSFIFLWVGGGGMGLEHGRQCLKKWGFRRCEDICWVKRNRDTTTPALRHDSTTLFQRTKEHCLMGIKGTVHRSTDGHIIHANIDTDVIVADEPPYGSTAKPDEIYRIIENFSLGSRRLELFGEDHNIRRGWVTLGKGLSSSNFDSKAYIRNFTDKEGKVWQGRGGRLPPPQAPHLVQTTPEIEALRPKSPMKNQL